jgi:hypothetical protein
MKIITSLFTDKHDFSKNPQLSHLNYSSKRMAYWQCCITFFATSVKVNPNERHVLYTNDFDDVIFIGINLKEFLLDLGIEIIYHPMEVFNVPDKFTSMLAGAFYKLEVLNDLGENNDSDVCLLDSDCVWIKPCDPIKRILKTGKIILFDVYKLKNLETENPHGTSRKELLEAFKEIKPDYPNPTPVMYGGEIIAGNAKNIKVIAQKLRSAYQQIIPESGELPKFKNGKKFMDGMEVFSSFVYNMLNMKHVDSEEAGIMRRIWTAPNINNASITDMNLMIWHLIAEKHRGIPILSERVLEKNSVFWRLENEKIGEFLGGYLGIPERKVKIKEKSFLETLLPRIENKLKEKIAGFK